MEKIFIFLVLVLASVIVFGCVKNSENQSTIREVEVKSEGSYIYKKIYVVDHKGQTHEILTSSSGNRLGGVGMIELCVYREE